MTESLEQTALQLRALLRNQTHPEGCGKTDSCLASLFEPYPLFCSHGFLVHSRSFQAGAPCLHQTQISSGDSVQHKQQGLAESG